MEVGVFASHLLCLGKLYVDRKSHILARCGVVPARHDKLARNGVLDIFVYLKHAEVSFVFLIHVHGGVYEAEDA